MSIPASLRRHSHVEGLVFLPGYPCKPHGQGDTRAVLGKQGPGQCCWGAGSCGEATDACLPVPANVQRAPCNRALNAACAHRDVRCTQLVRVADDNGIRFPREFGLLLKQLLYFDRYTRLLAPKLSVLSDDRITRTGRPAGPLYP